MEDLKHNTKPLYSLAEITKYFLKLGTWRFGGPVAVVGNMQGEPYIIGVAAIIGLLIKFI